MENSERCVSCGAARARCTKMAGGRRCAVSESTNAHTGNTTRRCAESQCYGRRRYAEKGVTVVVVRASVMRADCVPCVVVAVCVVYSPRHEPAVRRAFSLSPSPRHYHRVCTCRSVGKRGKHRAAAAAAARQSCVKNECGVSGDRVRVAVVMCVPAWCVCGSVVRAHRCAHAEKPALPPSLSSRYRSAKMCGVAVGPHRAVRVVAVRAGCVVCGVAGQRCV